MYVLGQAEPVAEDLDSLGDIAFELALGGALKPVHPAGEQAFVEVGPDGVAHLEEQSLVIGLPGFVGDSGSPVLVKRGNAFLVVAIHVATMVRPGHAEGVAVLLPPDLPR